MRTAAWILLLLMACDEGRPQPIPGTPVTGRDASASTDGSLDPDAGGRDAAARDAEPQATGAETCEQYVRCVAASNPGALGLISAQYTAGGSCWTTTPDLCESACITGLRQSHAAFPGTAECPACVADRHCEDVTAPACDAQAGECVSCTGDEDCSPAAPACDLGTNRCVGCTNRSYCPQGVPACDLPRQACVECLGDSDCPSARPGCITQEKRCATCTRDEHCGGATPICNTNSNTCVACARDEHCPSDRPICHTPLFGSVASCVECAPFGGGCAPSETCRSNTCQALDCAGVQTECGPFEFSDGVRLECGTCTAPQQCIPREVASMTTRNVCGLRYDTVCDPRQPDACGRRARCVWDPGESESTGECVEDTTGRSCTGPGDRACIYEGNLGGITNFGTCVAMRCRPLCSVDAHCRNGGTCQRQASGAFACVE